MATPIPFRWITGLPSQAQEEIERNFLHIQSQISVQAPSQFHCIVDNTLTVNNPAAHLYKSVNDAVHYEFNGGLPYPSPQLSSDPLIIGYRSGAAHVKDVDNSDFPLGLNTSFSNVTIVGMGFELAGSSSWAGDRPDLDLRDATIGGGTVSFVDIGVILCGALGANPATINSSSMYFDNSEVYVSWSAQVGVFLNVLVARNTAFFFYDNGSATMPATTILQDCPVTQLGHSGGANFYMTSNGTLYWTGSHHNSSGVNTPHLEFAGTGHVYINWTQYVPLAVAEQSTTPTLLISNTTDIEVVLDGVAEYAVTVDAGAGNVRFTGNVRSLTCNGNNGHSQRRFDVSTPTGSIDLIGANIESKVTMSGTGFCLLQGTNHHCHLTVTPSGGLTVPLQLMGCSDSLIEFLGSPLDLSANTTPYSLDANSNRNLILFGGKGSANWGPGTDLGSGNRIISYDSVLRPGESVQGPPGPPGSTGEPGEIGPPGTPGSDGAPGAPGSPGSPGSPGADGAPGAAGSPGQQGSQGPPGDPGTPGDQGEPGPTGADGATGAQGIQGNTGSAGAAGAAGSQGPPGNDGIDGEQGPPGDPGSNGAQGIQGIQGNTGATGATVTGAQGPPGMDGVLDVETHPDLFPIPGQQGPPGEVAAFTGIADATTAGVATDRYVAYTSITATRTYTLPPAAALRVGERVKVVDASGSVTFGAAATGAGVISILIAPAGSDTINGGTVSAQITLPYGYVEFIKTSATGWTIVDQTENWQWFVNTAGSTWTKRPGYSMAHIWAVGAGGGGGSGRCGTTAASAGGCGGSSGNVTEEWFNLNDLPATATVIAPTGTAGGLAVGTAAANGNNGGSGTTVPTSFNSPQVVALEGAGGNLGAAADLGSGQSWIGWPWQGNFGGGGKLAGGAVGFSSSADGPTVKQTTSVSAGMFARSPGGGGGGAGGNSLPSNGGAGGAPAYGTAAGTYKAGAIVNGASAAAGLDGGPFNPGGGGGGGCGGTATTGQPVTGGNGGTPGGGGGGGGGAVSGGTAHSGAGGQGGHGAVLVIQSM